MGNETTAITMPAAKERRGRRQATAALLVAFAPRGAVSTDRVAVNDSLVLGRSSTCDLQLRDAGVSKQHARIVVRDGRGAIDDLGSTNGTFVNGTLLAGPRELEAHDVIRIGDVLFVWHPDAETLLEPAPSDRHGIAGKFHASALLRQLKEASLSARHMLLEGPTGSGKELAAAALAALCGNLRLVTHNAARFSSEEEASATLFGVATRVFSGVDPRSGLIEEASDGMLFLDEIHNLPLRVQRSLLRIMETGEFARIGESRTRQIRVRFVLASNAPPPDHGLAEDLLARLRVVSLPPLVERRADIPSLFLGVTPTRLERQGVAPQAVLDQLTTCHMEALCLHGMPRSNVRGLIDIADRIATRIAAGGTPSEAIDGVLEERLDGTWPLRRPPSMLPEEPRPKASASAAGKTSHYEANKQAILAAVEECAGNLSAAERLLHARGIRSSRQWLTHFVKRWNER